MIAVVCVVVGGEGEVKGVGEGVGCLVFHCFVVCVLPVLVCLLFLLVSLVGLFCDCGSSWTSFIQFCEPEIT